MFFTQVTDTIDKFTYHCISKHSKTNSVFTHCHIERRHPSPPPLSRFLLGQKGDKYLWKRTRSNLPVQTGTGEEWRIWRPGGANSSLYETEKITNNKEIGQNWGSGITAKIYYTVIYCTWFFFFRLLGVGGALEYFYDPPPQKKRTTKKQTNNTQCKVCWKSSYSFGTPAWKWGPFYLLFVSTPVRKSFPCRALLSF